MTTAGINGAIAQIGIYCGSNFLIGKPDVIKEMQEAKITTQYSNRTKQRKTVMKTKSIGKLETLMQKNTGGNYSLTKVTYYSNSGTQFDIFP